MHFVFFLVPKTCKGRVATFLLVAYQWFETKIIFYYHILYNSKQPTALAAAAVLSGSCDWPSVMTMATLRLSGLSPLLALNMYRLAYSRGLWVLVPPPICLIELTCVLRRVFSLKQSGIHASL